MLLIATVVSRNIVKTASDIALSLLDLSSGKGNLNHQLTVNGNDDLGQVSTNFNLFLSLLRSSISDIINVASPLNMASVDLKQKMAAVNALANKQETEASNVSKVITGMQKSVQDMSENAIKALDSSGQVKAEVTKGQEIIRNTINISEELNDEIAQAASLVNMLSEDAKEVDQFLNVIDNISSQTNLLALNAAIEAARAGEHGRGFAVVADEVRTLAQRTQTSTQEIQEMIGKLRTSTRSAVEVMDRSHGRAKDSVEKANQVSEVIEKIVVSVASMMALNKKIASTASEQGVVTNKINANTKIISDIADQTAAGGHKVEQSNETLVELSKRLAEMVKQFKLA